MGSSVQRSVLYIHPVAAFGGASRSLLELLGAFPPGTIRPRLLLPRGQAAGILAQHGIEAITVPGITQFDCTRFGFYRGLRWLVVLREAYYLPSTLWGLLRARRRWSDVDLIHVNEVTALLPAVLAKLIFRRPLLIHVRSVQKTDGIKLRRGLRDWALRARADAVVAIDETVRASLPSSLPVEVVHNGFTPDQSGQIDDSIRTVTERLRKESLKVGMVGNLLAMKGVYDLLEAMRLCVHVYGADVELVLVGGNPRRLVGVRGMLLKALGFAHDVEADVERFVADRGLADRVHRVGFTPHVSAVYRMLDVLCFPSHLDAVGRPVYEAAWFGVPSIVAMNHALPDSFCDGTTGMLVPPHEPDALARAIVDLAGNRRRLQQLGEAAQRLAREGFDSRRNASRMLRIYERLCPLGQGA